jgi:hypothetical protein
MLENIDNTRYLHTKREKLGHLLSFQDDLAAAAATETERMR